MDIKTTPSYEKFTKQMIVGDTLRKLTIIKPNIPPPSKNFKSVSNKTRPIKRVARGCSGCSRKSSKTRKRG